MGGRTHPSVLDKRTGEDAGAVEMPAKQTGSPMSYQIDGDGAELLAYAMP
jgi:hypothetical protein